MAPSIVRSEQADVNLSRLSITLEADDRKVALLSIIAIVIPTNISTGARTARSFRNGGECARSRLVCFREGVRLHGGDEVNVRSDYPATTNKYPLNSINIIGICI